MQIRKEKCTLLARKYFKPEIGAHNILEKRQEPSDGILILEKESK